MRPAFRSSSITVRCSRGTYVRTLACDIGEALGCGAHLCELQLVLCDFAVLQASPPSPAAARPRQALPAGTRPRRTDFDAPVRIRCVGLAGGGPATQYPQCSVWA